ncbi:hypothetical protein SAMN02910447_01004 [Ruminococcus sp. YE71]|uniref:hypothetical protein n=1 Tax=unclassified Ruminococcus TaxID=2608920 RepID=UPI00088A32B0|nr:MULTISPECIES: hypothetical protein [unclassified Ruminococcus]SDA15839.1 hypothetical protein SAMN02910446_01003 [Ruminococcus sp. YE78]SFW23280.1 hypothetical protein SAMN02910447_01004 [Ruminococcus sp. YE71]
MKLRQATVPRLPVWSCILLTALLSAVVSAVSGILFILIASAPINTVIVVLSTAVLVLMPAFAVKTLCVFIGFRERRLTTLLLTLGYLASLWASFAFYVSHDYELSVYRYMRATDADVYYFGGYEDLHADYADAADFMIQMQQAPASIVLESMSEGKLRALTAEQLETINSESLWDYFDYSHILGKSADEVDASLRAARTMNAYDFTFDYRGLRAKNWGYMLEKPSRCSDEIRSIAKYGSHAVKFDTFSFFIFAQLAVIVMIGVHFDIDAKGQLIYVYEPLKLEMIKAIVRRSGEALREMKQGWKIK